MSILCSNPLTALSGFPARRNAVGCGKISSLTRLTISASTAEYSGGHLDIKLEI